jgi:enolase-phosphatase E1
VSRSAKSNRYDRVRVLLLDVEGTTTPIDFVYKTLFPYASREVESFLREHLHEDSDSNEIVSLIGDLRGQRGADEASGLQPTAWRDDDGGEATILSAVDYVRWLMAKDSKCTPLKSLQGKIWQQGFENGALHGEVYEDVAPAFARWRKQGREICIYSSGSVLAQRLLFGSVASGDLTPFISNYFDTRVGAKTAASSYRKIAKKLGRAEAEILFVSDASKEIAAAVEAGMQAVLCVRDGAENVSGFDVIRSFEETRVL